MAKKGRKPGTTDYKKLATRTAMELADKKKALARAEKNLAAASKNHQELLQETARLDMLERSLKALVEGTEAPTNVKYVYTYPPYYGNQYGWWWGGNPYGWYWNGNTWTVNLNGQQNYNFQGGQYTIPSVNTINTTVGDAPVITTTAGTLQSGSTIVSNANAGSNTMCYNSDVLNASNYIFTSSSAGLPSASFTTTNGPSGGVELTVDLSTGAEEEDSAVDVTEGQLLATASKLVDEE